MRGLRIKEQEVFTLIDEMGHKVATIKRFKANKGFPKEYIWAATTEARMFASTELREMAEILDEHNAAEPLRPGVNEASPPYCRDY